MKAQVEYLGSSETPNRADGDGEELTRLGTDLRDRLAAAALAAADEWNEQTNNTLLGGSNTVEHYRLTLDFSARKRETPIEVV